MMTLTLFVLIQYQSVTDRRTETNRETDGHLCYINTTACIVFCAIALVKIYAFIHRKA